jgi:hypothetical protein
MRFVYGTLIALAFVSVLGVTFGYAIEAGGGLTEGRIKLAAPMQASDDASDRPRGTLE